MWIIGTVVVWLVWCCWVDIKDRRIPNALTVSGLAAGVTLQAFLPPGNGLLHVHATGGTGLVDALQAVVTMFLVTVLLWRARLFGAGDAKLFIALAAFAGMSGIVSLLLLSVCAGGLLALWRLAHDRVLGLVPRLTCAALLQPAPKLPYSMAILGGSVAHILLLASRG